MRSTISIDWLARALTVFFNDDSHLRCLIEAGRQIIEGRLPMAITITDSQRFTATIYAVDARGNPASLDGPVIWEVSDTALLTLNVSADGVATVSATGPVGTGQLRVSADADLGEGVRTLTGILDVSVIAGEAVSLVISPSIPEEQ